jgi:hypothetical protein
MIKAAAIQKSPLRYSPHPKERENFNTDLIKSLEACPRVCPKACPTALLDYLSQSWEFLARLSRFRSARGITKQFLTHDGLSTAYGDIG